MHLKKISHIFVASVFLGSYVCCLGEDNEGRSERLERSELFLSEDSQKKNEKSLHRKNQLKILLEGPASVKVGEMLVLQMRIVAPQLRDRKEFIDSNNYEKASGEQGAKRQPDTTKSSDVTYPTERLQGDPQKGGEEPAYTYKLEQAPKGAYLDQNRGQVRWIPNETHTQKSYTFVVSLSSRDSKLLDRKAFIVVVNHPLAYFGYDYFKPAQESIELRRREVKEYTKSRATKKPSSKKEAVKYLSKEDQSVDRKDLEEDTKGSNSKKRKKAKSKYQLAEMKSKKPLNSIDPAQHFVGPEHFATQNISAAPTDRYQLGPGDVLHVKYWSPTLRVKEEALQVDSKGTINVPVTNKSLVVRGQTLQQLESLLKSELATGIRNPQLTVTLREARPIKITIAGESFVPGSYHLPAVTTLFNALYVSGGPTISGSLRNIIVKKPNGQTLTFDFYKFLMSGDDKQDAPLGPGDVIFIPPVGTRVTIKGEVKRPCIYELKEGETIRHAIGYAGDLKSSGVAQRVSVDSTQPGVAKRLIDVDLTQNSPTHNPVLHDGDIVEVLSVRPILSNAVSITGAVDQPSKYELTQDMTIADLVERARGLIDEAHKERADVFRVNPDGTQSLTTINLANALKRDPKDNILLKRDDHIVVYSEGQVRWLGHRYVEVKGAVQKPGKFYRADNLKLSDVLLQANGLQPEASMDQAFVQRYNKDGTLGELMKINLNKVLAKDSLHDILLDDRDVIKIQTVTEASFIPEQMVKVLGAVQKPGVYPKSANMKIADLVELAGGLLPDAAAQCEVTHVRVPVGTPSKVVDIKRALAQSGVDNIALSEGDIVSIPSDTNIRIKPRMITIVGEVARPGTYALDHENETLSSLIRRAGGCTENSFPEGTQFMRKKEFLKTAAQGFLTSRIDHLLKLVQKGEYERLAAVSEFHKLKAAARISSPSTMGLMSKGLGVLNPADVQTLMQMNSKQTQTNSESQSGEQSSEMDKMTQRLIAAQVAGGMSSTMNNLSSPTTLLPVTPARELTDSELIPWGYLNINMPLALKTPGSYDDIRMCEGDLVVLPKKPCTVSVVGAVVLPSAVIYHPKKNVRYYVERAGGYTDDASLKRMIVIKPYGMAVRARMGTILELGDTLYVPTEVIARKYSDRDLLGEVQSTFIQVAGTVATLSILRALSCIY